MDTRKKILEYVRTYVKHIKVVPTLTEIANAVGIKQTAVKHHLDKLAKEGKIEKLANANRFKLTEDTDESSS